MDAYPHVCPCITAASCPWVQKRILNLQDWESTNHYELLYKYQEPNSFLIEDQPVSLTIKPSLQHTKVLLFIEHQSDQLQYSLPIIIDLF